MENVETSILKSLVQYRFCYLKRDWARKILLKFCSRLLREMKQVRSDRLLTYGSSGRGGRIRTDDLRGLIRG